MGATYFENFARNDGSLVTVEYSYSPGSETTYSPMYGASGGDGCEVEIISSWPDTAVFERLCGLQNGLTWPTPTIFQRPGIWIGLLPIKLAIWFLQWRSRLSDDERERMEASIAEHHVYEPAEEDYY